MIPEQDIVVAFNSGITEGAYPHMDLLLNYILPEPNTDWALDESTVFNLVVGIVLIVPLIATATYWLFSAKRKIQ